MLQLLQIKEQESYIHLISKLNKNFDLISLSSGGNVGPVGPQGVRGLLGPNGLRGIRFFFDGDVLSDSIKGDWLIFQDGSVQVKNSLGDWILIPNFNLKGPRGLQGDSGETAELNRFAGTLGDAFSNSFVFSPNQSPTNVKSANARDFISLKRKQDVFIIGDVQNIKSKYANFPQESQIPSLTILQSDNLPNGKNGISIGSDNLKNLSSPNTASSDYKLFAHLYIDDDGIFQIQKDYNSILITSNENVTIGSQNEFLVIGKNSERGIFGFGNKIELSTETSSIKQNINVEIKNSNSTILLISGKSNTIFNDESILKIKQNVSELNIGIIKLQNLFDTNGYGTIEYNGFLGKVQLTYPNSVMTGNFGENIIQNTKPLYISKNGSIILMSDSTKILSLASSLPDSSLLVSGLLNLNKNRFSNSNSKYIPLSDDYGNITLYDDNGQVTPNSNPENGFTFGPFYKSNFNKSVQLIKNYKFELGEVRNLSELSHGISIKTSINNPSISPSILLSSTFGYLPHIEFRNNSKSKTIKIGSVNSNSNLKEFELPIGQGSDGGILATLSDPLDNFSDNWRNFIIKKINNNEISDFKLKKFGGLTPNYWYKTIETDLSFFDNIKLSNGRTFQYGNFEHLTPYSKISIQRLNKEIYFLKFSITLVQSQDYNNNEDNLDFLEIEFNDRIGVLKPIKQEISELDFDGSVWFPCSIYGCASIQRDISIPINWNDNVNGSGGVKKFVRSEFNHSRLNSSSIYNGNFTLDRTGNNKTSIQFCFESIPNNVLKSGITFSGSCIVYGYKEKYQTNETFDSILFDEED